MPAITTVGERDLSDLLPLMRAYCDFYSVAPTDSDLLSMSRSLIADPQTEGVQMIARGSSGRADGFATLFWSWNTLTAKRLGVMNDLFVQPAARGTGLADALIEACLDACRHRGGVSHLSWQTALDNARACAVYDRMGATRDQWLDYSLRV
jgi:GNAT superfamily N-acetyltransferase